MVTDGKGDRRTRGAAVTNDPSPGFNKWEELSEVLAPGTVKNEVDPAMTGCKIIGPVFPGVVHPGCGSEGQGPGKLVVRRGAHQDPGSAGMGKFQGNGSDSSTEAGVEYGFMGLPQ